MLALKPRPGPSPTSAAIPVPGKNARFSVPSHSHTGRSLNGNATVVLLTGCGPEARSAQHARHEAVAGELEEESNSKPQR